MAMIRLPALFLLLAAPRPARAGDGASALERGHALYFEGRPAQARDAYREAASSTGTRVEALKSLAVVQRELGDLGQAVLSLKEARRLAPDDARLAEELAWALYLSGDPKRARELARGLAGSTLARFTAAAADLDRGKSRRSVKELQALLSQAPHFLPAFWELGRGHEARKDWKSARQDYEQALKADYTYSELRLSLARVLQRLRRDKDALWQMLEVRKVDPRQPDVLGRLPELDVLVSSRTTEKAEAFAASAPSRRLSEGLPLAPGRETSPRVRVGIGTSPSGKPMPSSGLLFMAGGPFRAAPKGGGAGLLGDRHEAWRVEASTQGLRLYPPQGEPLSSTGTLVLETLSSTHTFLLHNVPVGAGFAWSGGRDREYRGRIELVPDPSAGVVVVNDLPLEEYLYSVLPSEMPGDSPLEALKAQAVVARTHALRRTGADSPHRGAPYDLCDGQHCQVYSGVRAESPRARRAVDETLSLVLRQAGRLISALFQANCGGHTQTASDNEGWAPDASLQGRPDGPDGWPRSPWELELGLKGTGPDASYCAGSSRVNSLSHRWAWVIPADALAERVRRRKDIGALRQVLPLGRAPSGYLRGVRFVGDSGELVVTREHEIRRIMAVGQVRSALFSPEGQYDRAGRLLRVFVFGGGWGHGVGLCQGGAVNMAGSGRKTFLDILLHYYTGVAVESLRSSASAR